MALPVLTVFDLETTGLDPRRGHRVIEIAAVRIENGVIQKETAFNSLVNPERSIPAEAKNVHGIGDDDVKNAPGMMTVLPQFLEFARGSILVAHNAAFDTGFLQAEKEFCWGYIELPECLCTMRLSQSLFPSNFRHSLDALSTQFGYAMPQGRHRALPDVLLTADILLRMLDHGKIQSMDELRRRASLAEMSATR